MAIRVDRRGFLKRGAAGVGGALSFAGPLTAFAQRAYAGQDPHSEGYGPLIDRGELALPNGFNYKVISREGDLMSDGNPTPGIFDGMAAFEGKDNTTILIRNHENRNRAGEAPVIVPDEFKYDTDARANGGNTKVVVDRGGVVLESFAILGGTATNCAGGATPWGTWITSEEVFGDFGMPHGYNFEIDAHSDGPVTAVPIRRAGRLVHEAVVWYDGALYQTEDRSGNACLYRYLPDSMPRRAGDLAASTGVLQALRLVDFPAGVSTDVGWPVGESFGVEWVDLTTPEPTTDSVRAEAAGLGAALFDRQEGMWLGGGKVYFDCTSGGAANLGQIWELDPAAATLTLIYESPGPEQLKNPDNLVVVPQTGHLLLCEDADPPMFLRGLTTDGQIYDFARAIDAPDSEFAGACFDRKGGVLYVNQQGNRGGTEGKVLGRTYAIRGPWRGR